MRLGTSFKVTLGYLVLIVLLLGSIAYIYDKLRLLDASEKAELSIAERRRATNSVVSRLYEAEVIGQYVSMGLVTELPVYHRVMEQVRMEIDTLSRVFTNNEQRLRLDTLKNLLMQKEKNMTSLLAMMNDAQDQVVYRNQVRKLIAQQDTVVSQPKIQKKIVTDNQSYIVKPKKKKKFFQRLAEAFSRPKEEDTTEVSKVVQEVYIDTLQQEAYNAADTLVNILQRAEDSVIQHQSKRSVQINTRLRKQQAAAAELSKKVNQLLETIEIEEQALLSQRMKQEQYLRQNAIQTMACFAFASVLLALVFSVIIWRDITRSNHYRRELEKAKNRAEELLEAREKLMLTITHDIKAPVGSIIGYIDLLARLLHEKRALFYLDNMKSSARHLLDLVTSLLDFHRLDAHKMDIQNVPFDPWQLFDTLYHSFVPLTAQKGLEITCEIDERLKGSFMGDPFRIRQITENLMSNALKFTEKGQIGLKVKLEEDGRMHIAVSDTGCGMSLAEQKKVFQAFTRLKNAQGQEGFGLGLAITQKLVGLLQGEIRIGSHVGHGTTFHVFLPLEKHTDTSVEMAAAPVLEASLNILMIDDDQIQMQLHQAMLENLKLKCPPRITLCHCADELFQSLKEQHYDLLITDIQMPGLNGFDLLKQVRQLPEDWCRQLPVIAITARSDMSEADFKAFGFATSLYKPFSQRELLQAIVKSLGYALETTGEVQQAEIQNAEDGMAAEESGISLAPLLQFAEGDVAAQREIATTFIAENKRHYERMRQAWCDRQIQEAGAVAHKMLPTYTLIHASSLLPLLQQLEGMRHADGMSDEVAEKIQNILLPEIQKIIVQVESEYSAK